MNQGTNNIKFGASLFKSITASMSGRVDGVNIQADNAMQQQKSTSCSYWKLLEKL